MSPKNRSRLPLRWGVILIATIDATALAIRVGGPLIGLATCLATTALLHKILQD